MIDDAALYNFCTLRAIVLLFILYAKHKNICNKTANGVEVLRANIETDYGTVHIIDGLMDRPRLMDSCPTLKQRLSSGEGQQAENIKSNHSISIRRVSEEDLLASFEYDPSIRTNEIDQNTFDTDVVIVPFVEQSDQSLTEAKYGKKTGFFFIRLQHQFTM